MCRLLVATVLLSGSLLALTAAPRITLACNGPGLIPERDAIPMSSIIVAGRFTSWERLGTEREPQAIVFPPDLLVGVVVRVPI